MLTADQTTVSSASGQKSAKRRSRAKGCWQTVPDSSINNLASTKSCSGCLQSFFYGDSIKTAREILKNGPEICAVLVWCNVVEPK